MADQSSLLVSQVPSSFAALGEKHNALVDLLRTMTGTGCKVTFSENKIIIAVPTFSVPDPLTVGTINNTTLNGSNAYFYQVDSTYGAFTSLGATDFFVNSVGTYSISLPATSITRNMTIKEVDVCDGGVAKKMLIVASDPY